MSLLLISQFSLYTSIKQETMSFIPGFIKSDETVKKNGRNSEGMGSIRCNVPRKNDHLIAFAEKVVTKIYPKSLMEMKCSGGAHQKQNCKEREQQNSKIVSVEMVLK